MVNLDNKKQNQNIILHYYFYRFSDYICRIGDVLDGASYLEAWKCSVLRPFGHKVPLLLFYLFYAVLPYLAVALVNSYALPWWPQIP